VEHPKLGEFGVYQSDGANKPYCMKLRSARLLNLQSLDEMARALAFADAVTIIGDAGMCSAALTAKRQKRRCYQSNAKN
jgi:NADH:ubiquinone oxidoreductase subunit D